mmetsp:Transcript_9202/g.20782  ORF Transcript_9202/g.20782 Transcript_9202/m.20782 type:complete len:591 (-) Transcript_9202:813-2585(-)
MSKVAPLSGNAAKHGEEKGGNKELGLDAEGEEMRLKQLAVVAFGKGVQHSVGTGRQKSERLMAIEAKMQEQRSAPAAELRAQRMKLLFDSTIVEGSQDQVLDYMADPPKPGKYTINPQGNKWCGYFDQVIAVALVWTALATPYELAFLGADSGKFNAMFFIGQFVNLVFIIDLVLQFFLHFETITTMGIVMEGNHEKIIKNYAYGNFSMDFISSVPWSLVEMAIPGDNGGSLGVLRLLRLLRLLKLLKIARGNRLIEKYRAEVDFSFSRITLYAYVFIIMLFAHWVACIWGYTAAESPEGEGWISSKDLYGAPPFHKFTVAFYFAVMTITTVGYGDVTPTNQSEFLVCTAIMVVGGFLWAYVIGGICTVVGSMDTDKAKFQSDFDRINFMLKDLGMTRSFSVYVRKYLFNAEEMLRRQTYDELVELLTPYQQREVALHRAQANLTTVPYFRDCSPELVTRLYSCLKHVTYAPQESMDMPFTLYLIANNGLALRKGKVYSNGACLNTDFLIDSEQHIDPTVAVALSFVQVECLDRDDLNEVLDIFPSDRQIIRKAKIRISFIREVWNRAAPCVFKAKPLEWLATCSCILRR